MTLTRYAAADRLSRLDLPASKYRDDISFYNLSPSSVRNWRNAYAKQKNGEGHAHIGFYGDSVTNGYQGTSPYYQNSWPARVKALIDAKTGVDKGTGFVSTGQLAQLGGENRFSFPSGTWSALGFGPSQLSLGSNSGSATMQVGPITCDRIRVYYAQLGNGGTVTSTLDGSASTSFSCNGAGSVAFTDYTATSGSHTLVLTAPASTSQYAYIIGWEAFKNGTSSGVRMSTLGYNGTTANDLLNSGAYNSLLTSMNMLAPDLCFIAYGANDVGANNPAQFQTRLQTAITQARSINADVVLVTLAPIPNATTTVAVQQAHVDVMYALADANDVCVLDIYKRFGVRGASVTEALMFDAQHPNSRGYWDIAHAVATALLATTVA